MTTPAADPAQRRLEHDLTAAEFESGVAAGMWRIERLDWPYLFAAIAAGDEHELGMRLAIDSYPALAPAGQPWDLDVDGPLPLALWPTGGTAPQIFRADWSVGNGNAPYMSCDRVGLRTHPDWATVNAHRAWNATRTIAFYLRRSTTNSDAPPCLSRCNRRLRDPELDQRRRHRHRDEGTVLRRGAH